MGSSINIGGLASGVQWRDLVDQLAAADRARFVTPLQTQVSDADKRKSAFTELNSLVQKLADASKSLQLGTAFSSFSASASPSTQTNRALVTTSANASARPGSYRVEVLDLARAEKLSGAVMSSSTTALGLNGTFSVAGRTVTVAAGDSLEGVRDKINALNTGSDASKVSASVLTSGSGQQRLIISADVAGSTGTSLTDGAQGVLRDLGFVDSRSRAIPSASLAVAAALGVTMPPPSSIRVGDRTISIDLNLDSLSSIVAKIRAAGGQADVQSETVGGVPSWRLSVGGTVSPTADVNSADTISALGFAAGGQTGVQQVVASATAFQTAGGAPAGRTTPLTALFSGGLSLGIAVGDTLTFSGQRGDGSAVRTSFVVGGADTLETLVSKLNDSAEGFGGTARAARASIDPDGRLRLADGTAGDSRLRLAMSVAPAMGGSPAALLGAFNTETVGRSRAMVAGSDAQLRVDGVLLTRPSNTISDVLDGVTINLLQAEAGTEIGVTVTRDTDAAVKSIKDFAKAYNDIVTFSSGQQLNGQPLQGNTTLRRVLSTFTQALRTEVPSAGDFSRGTLAGFTLTRSGSIEVDDTKLRSAIGTNLTGIQALFGPTGIAQSMVTSTTAASRAVDGTIANAITNITDSNARISRRITDAQDRVEARRTALLARFTSMELSINRLQAQGTSLTSSLTGVGQSRR